MSTAPGGSEAPSKKRQVVQIAILLGIAAIALFVIAANLRNSNSVLTVPAPPEEMQSADAAASPGDIAREAMRIASLRPESSGVSRDPRAEVMAGRPPATPTSDTELLAGLMESLGRQGAQQAQEPVGIRQPPTGPTPQEQAKARAMAALSAPMAGVVKTDDGDNGFGSAAAGVGTHGAVSEGSSLPPGTVIEGRTTMKLSSDYPGAPWSAITTRPVHFSGGKIAIPAGSAMIGTIQADQGPNQVLGGKLNLRLERIALPNGSVIAAQAPVLDEGGGAAIPGKTKRHVLAQGLGVLASALLGAARLDSAGTSPLSARDQLEAESIEGAAQQATPLVQRYLSVQPTVQPALGTAVRIFLVEPLAVPAA